MPTFSERQRATPAECTVCNAPFRHWKATAIDAPGTVAHAGRGLCRRCYSWRVEARNQAGISLAQWHALLVDQSGRCASCADPMRCPYVDHDHETGVVRGLLCQGCNTAEGYLKGDPNRARALAAYMERHARAGT